MLELGVNDKRLPDILSNHGFTDFQRREHLFNGEFLIYSSSLATRKLVQYAQALISDAFKGDDPRNAQSGHSVTDFVGIISPLKTQFTNNLDTKKLVQEVLVKFGCDLEKTYFDVPRLRVVPFGNYLSSGVSYAYKAHRDTWYSSPHAQINWWIPVFDICPDQAMSLFPAYWNNVLENNSGEFDYDEWCRVSRPAAESQIDADIRKHPLPLSKVDTECEIRICGALGDVLLFSAAHLHSTAENTSSQTRFSIDFRTVNIDDLLGGRSAPNIDSSAIGTTLGDFISASDFEPIETRIIEQHNYRTA